MKFNYNNSHKVAISGAGSGLGYMLVRKFAEKGLGSIIIGRNRAKIEKVSEEISKKDPQADILSIKCNIRNENDIKNTISHIKKTFGKIDILINNAGIRIESSVENMSVKEWKDVIDTNLTGTFLMTKYALPLLKKTKNSVIINISSIRGLYGGKNLSAYSASKFGIIGLSQSLAEELKNDGIKVYTICPVAMDTEMIKNVKHNIPQDRLIQPDEMADIVYNIVTNPNEPTGTTFVVMGKQTEILENLKKAKDYKIIQW